MQQVCAALGVPLEMLEVPPMAASVLQRMCVNLLKVMLGPHRLECRVHLTWFASDGPLQSSWAALGKCAHTSLAWPHGSWHLLLCSALLCSPMWLVCLIRGSACWQRSTPDDISLHGVPAMAVCAMCRYIG